MSKQLKPIRLRQLFKFGCLLLSLPICGLGVWIGLLMFGMIYAEASARNMQPSMPSDFQLVKTNTWGGSDGQSIQKIYYSHNDFKEVLAVMERQSGSFNKTTDFEGHEVYENLKQDRSLPMQIFSQANTKQNIPGSFPGCEIVIQPGRGADPTGTTIKVGIGWPN